MRIPEKYQDTRLLVVDFVKRNRDARLMLTIFYLLYMGGWLSDSRAVTTSAWEGWRMTANIIALPAIAMVLLLRNENQKVLRSLPVSKDNRGLAAWIEFFMLPLCICAASSSPFFLLWFVAGRFMVVLQQASMGALYVAANVFGLALLSALLAGVSPALLRPQAAGRIKRLFPTSGLLMLSGVALGAWLLKWSFTALAPPMAVLVLLAAAVPLFAVSFLLRGNLGIDLRAIMRARYASGNVDVVPVMPARTWRDRHYPWMAALRIGVTLGGAAALTLAGLIPETIVFEAPFGPEIVLLFVPVLLLATGYAMSAYSRQSLRAMRMLPCSTDHLARTGMAVHAALTMPLVAILCLGAFCLKLTTGETVSANIVLGTCLLGEACILLAIPIVLQQEEIVLTGIVILGACVTALVAVVVYQLLGPSWTKAVAVLPHLGAIALPVAAVVSFRLLRTAIANDSRSYQNRAEYLSWPKV